MKVTPQLRADLEEYPELVKLMNATLRPVVDLMGAHAILSMRRLHKAGVFDHPYDKDVITPINIPMPESVKAVQHMVGKALLDYLEAIGISGISLEVTQEEVQTIASLWTDKHPDGSCKVRDQDTTERQPEPQQSRQVRKQPDSEPKAQPTFQPEPRQARQVLKQPETAPGTRPESAPEKQPEQE